MQAWLVVGSEPARVFARPQYRPPVSADLLYPALLSVDTLRRPSSASGGEAANLSVELDNASGKLTALLAGVLFAAAKVQYWDGAVQTLFEGRIESITIADTARLDIVAEGLTGQPALRPATIATQFGGTAYHPHVYGTVTLAAIPYSDDGRRWLLADHAITRVRSVTVGGKPRGDGTLVNQSDSAGHAVAVLDLFSKADDAPVVELDGKPDTVLGGLLTSPAWIIWDILTHLAGQDIPRSRLEPLALAAADITLAGVIDGKRGTVRAELDAIAESIGAVWSMGMADLMALWPIATERLAAEHTARNADSLQATAIAPTTALRVNFGYDFAASDFSGSLLLESASAIDRYGRRERTLDAVWLPDARQAERIGRRLLESEAVGRFGVTFETDFKAVSLRPGDRVVIDHAYSPLAGQQTVTEAAVQIEAETVSVTLHGAISDGPTDVAVVARSTRYEPGSDEQATQYRDGVATITARDPDGQPLPGATITLGGIVRTADGNGQARFRLKPGSYTLTIEAQGFDPITQTVRLS